MAAAADTLIDRLQADCAAAEAQERLVRAAVEWQPREAMAWDDMCRLLESASTPWDGVALFVGLDTAGGPLANSVAAPKLREIEADVAADPRTFDRGLYFDRRGRQLRIDEVAR